MTSDSPLWPYLPTLSRLALALALGLFVGIERERRRKEAGLRTFAFIAALGALGGLLGTVFAITALALVGVLVILLNIETIRTGEGAEITTSAALLVMGFIGVLAGEGHTLTPTALTVAMAALLAWKEPLAGFSRAVTDGELRSAILLAILGFIVYPALPTTSIDPWHLVVPRAAWITVILIAALGFVNYILFKLYGDRGAALTGFLGGLVNSTVTVTELADRTQTSHGHFASRAFRGITLATTAMLVRNMTLLGLLAPLALLAAAIPLALMLGATTAVAFLWNHISVLADSNDDAQKSNDAKANAPVLGLSSPFSLGSALKYGAIFLALQVAGTLAQRALGEAGFYVVSMIGGVVSSASAVASAANLAATGTLPAEVAARGAILTSLVSALFNLLVVSRVARHRPLTRRITIMTAGVVVLGLAGMALQFALQG